ncbi:MAG: hypothetical protein WA842_09410 [Croceibacterium sp.]
MRRILAFAAAAALVTGSAASAADAQAGYDDAIKRLNACLSAGSAGAPRDSLAAAATALRSLCYTQIRRAHERRELLVERTGQAANPGVLEDLKLAARRDLDRQILLAISTFTGLQS